MTIEENNYEPESQEEIREAKKLSSAMLKGFTGVKFQKSSDSDEVLATAPETLALAKFYVSQSDDIETAYWKLASALSKVGVSLPKLDETTRSAIGSVSGQSIKPKIESEVEEGLGNAKNNLNRLSTGQPEAQVVAGADKPFSPIAPNRQGYTQQNQVPGKNPEIGRGTYTPYANPAGRPPTLGRGTDQRIGGTNPDFGTGRGEMGEIGSPGQSGQYTGTGHLQYDSISQRPGDARTTYKSFSPTFDKSGITLSKNSGEMETPALKNSQPTEQTIVKTKLVKVGGLSVPSQTQETDTSYTIKHMIAGQFKGITPQESMRAEEEALRSEAFGDEIHRDDESKLDEEDESKAEELESLADELEKRARELELLGNWKLRDRAYEMAKNYRAAAMEKMRAIRSRHGNLGLPTGM